MTHTHSTSRGLSIGLLLWSASVASGFVPLHSFPSSSLTSQRQSSHSSPQKGSASRRLGRKDDFDDDEEDDALALQDDDWRAFRAKLVMSEKEPTTREETKKKSELDDGDLDGIGSCFGEDFFLDTTTASSEQEQEDRMTPLDPSQWAYDSGDVIEQGAVILGGVEQKFGFGLRQQYFHKAAILVLDHDQSTFTKGILLNRPTDLMLEDDVNEGKRWRVWFGGDVEGLNARHPDIVCLHSLKNEMATKASIPVMKDIQWTTFRNAKKLVKAGVAEVRDFWVFVGYAGWGPGQLKGELERNSWYMVATDSQTLLKELARQGEAADPRDAGLETWSLLMNMIGRKETAKQHSGDFDDLMLKEWAFSHLLSTVAGGGGGKQQRDPQEFSTNPELVDNLMSRVMGSPGSESSAPLMEGALLRASPTDRSPFLLDKQELHKSVVIILSDDAAASVGVVLNRPSTKGLDIKVADKTTGGSKVVTIPMRFGGQYAYSGQESLLWLHCSDRLRQIKIGSPIGVHQESGIWKCNAQDVITAIGQGHAKPEDFLVVSGVSVWEKNLANNKNGIAGEIELGKFETIPSTSRGNVWTCLLRQQEVLTKMNFSRNLAIAEEAWTAADADGQSTQSNGNNNFGNSIGGLGEGFDEEDDAFVFKSDVKVSKLSDDALRSWCATFLLGMSDIGDL
jgi:putative AlgH/UPF0301 family transcriptional regulator